MKDKALSVVLIIFLCVQGFLYIKNNDVNNKEEQLEKVVQVKKEEKKEFNQFFQEISKIKGCNIKNTNNEKNMYTADITLKGDKNTIVRGLNNLDQYTITAYSVKIEKEDISATLSLNYTW